MYLLLLLLKLRVGQEGVVMHGECDEGVHEAILRRQEGAGVNPCHIAKKDIAQPPARLLPPLNPFTKER